MDRAEFTCSPRDVRGRLSLAMATHRAIAIPGWSLGRPGPGSASNVASWMDGWTWPPGSLDGGLGMVACVVDLVHQTPPGHLLFFFFFFFYTALALW